MIIPFLPDKIERQAEREKHYRFKGSMLKKPGLTLFEVDLLTEEITTAPIKKAESVTVDGAAMRDRLETKPNVAYLWALNIGNARKKWAKMKQLHAEKD